VQDRQQFRSLFFRIRVNPWASSGRQEWLKHSGYNNGVKFVLRDYRPEDFESLWSIDQKCFAPGIAYSQRELAAYIRKRGSFTLVAEAMAPHGKTPPGDTGSSVEPAPGIVGFIVAEHNRRGVGHVISIDVLPASRRFGVGSKLLFAVEDRLRVVACHTIVLETAVDNAPALAFYKRHRYSVAKIIPRYYSNGVDAFVLSKDLLFASEV